MPFVARHDDLTMANVLIERNESLGVIDWEMAHPDSWPLVDLVYALTDAVRIARRYTDRLDAFKTCFEPGGSYSLQAARLQTRLVSNLMISQEAIELSFHACWLHHAWNEYQKNQPEDSQPFFRILQWLVINTLNRKASVVKA
jgi:thiamine kinase-like enzyme